MLTNINYYATTRVGAGRKQQRVARRAGKRRCLGDGCSAGTDKGGSALASATSEWYLW